MAGPMTLLPDDAIAEARARLIEIEAARAADLDVIAAARAELDQIAQTEEIEGPGERGRDRQAARLRQAERARARIRQALDHRPELDRLAAEDRLLIEQLERKRIPAIDDQIAEARSKRAAIPAAIQRQEAGVASHTRHLVDLEASQALGEPLPAGEPELTTAALAEARAAAAALVLESERLGNLENALLGRREATASTLLDADVDEVMAHRDTLVEELVDTAVKFEELGTALEALDQDYAAAFARHGSRPGRIPTTESRFSAHELEILVRRARGQAIVGRGGR